MAEQVLKHPSARRHSIHLEVMFVAQEQHSLLVDRPRGCACGGLVDGPIGCPIHEPEDKPVDSAAKSISDAEALRAIGDFARAAWVMLAELGHQDAFGGMEQRHAMPLHRLYRIADNLDEAGREHEPFEGNPRYEDHDVSCLSCGRPGEIKSSAPAPDGWFDLTQWHEAENTAYIVGLFCSFECVEQVVQEIVSARREAESEEGAARIQEVIRSVRETRMLRPRPQKSGESS